MRLKLIAPITTVLLKIEHYVIGTKSNSSKYLEGWSCTSSREKELYIETNHNAGEKHKVCRGWRWVSIK